MIKEIQLGDQVWMSQNLDVNKFRNGEPIQQAKTDEEWQNAKNMGIPAWCYYDNEKANGINYGKLYNWHAVVDERGLAPEGWYIPTIKDWYKLKFNLEKLFPNSTALDTILSNEGWDDILAIDNTYERSGFNGVPGGYRTEYGEFFDLKFGGHYWCLYNKKSKKHTAFVAMSATSTDLFFSTDPEICAPEADKGFGFSVRCLKN
ncbi:fibrobacter succinogenes major paralogous domain-containing protein [Peijinzhouia sedimentorum]